MNFLFSNAHRSRKFCIAVGALLLMMAYSRYYGQSQPVPGTMAYAEALHGENIPFPYQKVVGYKDGYLMVEGPYGDRFEVEWRQPPVELEGRVSFMGSITKEKKIKNVHHVISHKGSSFKLYISIAAVLVLMLLTFPYFRIDRRGITIRERGNRA